MPTVVAARRHVGSAVVHALLVRTSAGGAIGLERERRGEHHRHGTHALLELTSPLTMAMTKVCWMGSSFDSTRSAPHSAFSMSAMIHGPGE